MHSRTPSLFGGEKPRRRRGPSRWPGVCLLLLCLSLLVSSPGVPHAFARSGAGPGPITPGAIQAIHQALHKQIHVTHTGHTSTRPPTPPARPRPSHPKPPHVQPAYNNVGVTDRNTHRQGNLDGQGRSYATQALQDVGVAPGVPITSQNITYTWPDVPPGQPDNYQAAGQVIPVAAPAGAATLGVLGLSAFGPSSGTATLTYTDGSTTTFTLDLTDWWNGSAEPNNQAVATMSTISSPAGTRKGTYYLYSVTTTLDTSKTLQSLTLPTTVSRGEMHVFAVGVGGSAFTNTGISSDSSPSAGNFDGAGNSYSAQALAGVDLGPNQPFDWDGIAYSWPDAPAGAVDNYLANGQVLPVVPVPGATTLGLLGAAINGATSGTATLTFSDTSTQTFTLGFTDWAQGTPAFGNTIAASMTYRNTPAGKQTITTSVFAAEVAIPASKTLVSVTLPTTVSGGQLHVFALGTRASLNNLGTSNDNQPGAGNYDGGGRSWSIQTLEAAHIQPGQPLIFNGVNFTWPASYGTNADNTLAAGQTIPVTPVPGATTLAFLGTSTNHTSSGMATITYTDGTSSTFTLGLTDWWDNNIQFGNKLVATFSTINIPGGTKSGSFYLYYAETGLTAGETIQSVTLPTSVSPGQLHIFAVGTRSDYNNIGISDNSSPNQANFDGAGNSYSAQDFADPTVAGWNPGDTLTYEGINYIWPNVSAGQGDNYVANGQTIPITAPAGATTLGFVGAGDFAYPTTSGTATLHYTDGTNVTFTLAMTDWLMDSDNIKPVPNEHLFALLPHHNTAQQTMAALSYLFEVETPLDSSKQLKSVTLPATVSQGRLHIFMMGTRTGENYPNNVGASHDGNTVFADLDGTGASYSIEALEGQGIFPGQSFPFNGVTFTWPDSASVLPDNFQAAGQTIPVTPVSGATTLAFLGAATNGAASGTAIMTFSDTSTQTFTLGFTDWAQSTTAFGNTIVASMPYRNTSTGKQTIAIYAFEAEVTIPPGKTLVRITLPTTVSGGQLHIFAIGTK